MHTTYHFDSAEDINQDIIDSIRATYKTRPIHITVEEDRVEFQLSDEQKAILDERLLEDTNEYIPAEVLLKNLRDRYGV